MRDLFARGLLDPEYLDRDGFGEDEQRLIAAMANNLGGAAYTFMNNMHNADDLDGQYEYLIPVVGPFGDQHVPGRGVGITYPAAAIMANAEDKAVELINMLEWILSEDGQRLFSFGVEGVTYDMVDGKPVLKPEYTTSFVDYRSAGMNYQLIPHVWLSDAYVQVFTNGKTVEEMDHVAQQFVYGAEQNEIYAMNFFKKVDEIQEAVALDTDLKTWANASAWSLEDDTAVEITDVKYDFDPETITPGIYDVTFATKGYEYKIDTTDKFEVGDEVGLTFQPEDIHIMSKNNY